MQTLQYQTETAPPYFEFANFGLSNECGQSAMNLAQFTHRPHLFPTSSFESEASAHSPSPIPSHASNESQQEAATEAEWSNDGPPESHSFSPTPPIHPIESTLSCSPLLLPQSHPVQRPKAYSLPASMAPPAPQPYEMSANSQQRVSIAFSPNQLTRLSDPTSIEPLILPPGTSPTSNLLTHHFDARAPTSSVQPVLSIMSGVEPLTAVTTPQAAAPRKAPAQRRRSAPSKSAATSNSRAGPNKATRRFCHVCRSPKELSRIVRCCSGKQSHVFCSSCVQRRLGLVFEELVKRNDWLCPKCENRCPCSKCRKRNPVMVAPPTATTTPLVHPPTL